MTIKIEKSQYAITFNEMKNFYQAGFRFYCDGDYRTTKDIDPWSGMPEVDSNTYFFDNRAEAEAFAMTQRWVFNPEVHAHVHEIKSWAINFLSFFAADALML